MTYTHFNQISTIQNHAATCKNVLFDAWQHIVSIQSSKQLFGEIKSGKDKLKK